MRIRALLPTPPSRVTFVYEHLTKLVELAGMPSVKTASASAHTGRDTVKTGSGGPRSAAPLTGRRAADHSNADGKRPGAAVSHEEDVAHIDTWS